MRLKNGQNYDYGDRSKKIKVVTCCGEGGCWLEQGVKELSKMMEMFSTSIQMQAAWVCVCHWAVYLRVVHFTECKLYQKEKKKTPIKIQTMNNTEWEICGQLTKEHGLLIDSSSSMMKKTE